MEGVAPDAPYASRAAVSDPSVEHLDVLVVGAGISGIDAAYHLSTLRPGTSFAVLEASEATGAPGWSTGTRASAPTATCTRSGTAGSPWVGPPIATAEQIQSYLGEVLEEHDLARHIRYHHRIDSASWSSGDARWTVEATRTDTGEHVRLTAGFLWMCQGYYRLDQGYTPEWPGRERFAGTVVHPQTWPEDLDLAGKDVLVIGSGATTATLVPAIADTCAHVTVLQRSPTYFYAGPNANELADMLRGLELPDEWVHEIVRRKKLVDLRELIQLSLDEPELVKDGADPHGDGAAAAGLRRRTGTSPPATTRGASGWPSCPTGTCSPGSRRGRRPW